MKYLQVLSVLTSTYEVQDQILRMLADYHG
jgi:hypothetical protein